MSRECFEWNTGKSLLTEAKHGVSFDLAQYAFTDPKRVITADRSHSSGERRYYCFGRVDTGILTVQFTWRNGMIRIIGAGDWRKGKRMDEQENQVQR